MEHEMQTYDCVVRIAGNVSHEVDKHGVTAPEVLILAHIHGTDGVRSVQPRAMKNHRHPEERARLEGLYGEKVVMAVFGSALMGGKLPLKLAADFGQTDEDEPDDEAQADDGTDEGHRDIDQRAEPRKTLTLEKAVQGAPASA
jgi:hypothetical protein